MNSNKGFSMTEMLIAVAILAITTSVVIIGVASARANMNKLSASESAKEIYIASENKMIEYKAFGEWEAIISENDVLPGIHIDKKPSDFDYWFENSDLDEKASEDYTWGKDGNMLYLSSTSKSDNEFIRNVLLPDGSIDSSVIDDAYFYIEYNQKTGAIYGVYYSFEDVSYEEINSYRENEFEVGETIVGYYGGGILSDNLSKTISDPYIKLVNGEELLLEISVDNETSTKISVTIEGDISKNQETININKDFTYTLGGAIHSLAGGENEGIISYGLILDSLTRNNDENNHFASLFPDLYPGEDIVITVYIRPTNEYLALPVVKKIETNSLFDAIDEHINVSAIRHLENLDNRISNLHSRVNTLSKVLVTSNISFSSFGDDISDDHRKNYYESDYICTYNNNEKEIFNPITKSFYPIELKSISSIEGAGHIIYDTSINLKGYEDLGIIGNCNSIKISNLGLVGSGNSEYTKYPTITAVNSNNLYVGAFIARCNNARISNCFSTTKINVEEGDSNASRQIFVGGFIGFASEYIDIKRSFGGGIADERGILEDSIMVSTPAGDSSSVSLGGFVGGVHSDELAEVFISDSYLTQGISLCNTTGKSAWIFEGGFVGSVKYDDSNIDIDGDSYIAAPMKSDIKAVTLKEINDYKAGTVPKRNIRFGGIVGGFILCDGSIKDNAPDINIEVDAKYVNYFADFCGVPELLSNNNYNYNAITKIIDVGLYYRNDFGRSVDIGELIAEGGCTKETIPISSYLNGHSYSFKNPTKLDSHYGDWQVKEYGTTISIVIGHGISEIDYGSLKYNDEKAIVNYGEEIDFSIFRITNLEGYDGKKIEAIPNNDGSDGILIENNGKYIFFAGVSTCEFLCSATEILPPKFEICGGGEFVYNYQDVNLQIQNCQNYAYDTSLTFSFLENDCEIDNDISIVEKNKIWSTNYSILKNAYRGTRHYSIAGKVSDGVLESEYSIPISREVILSRVRVNFNKNDNGSPPHGVNIYPSSCGFVEYGSSKIYKDETSDETIIPYATRTSYEFLGWSIPIGTTYESTELNDIENYALWKKVRHKIYTYSSGGWFYD